MSHLLTLNAGSSSLKFGLFTAAADVVMGGQVDRIGGAARLVLQDASGGDLAAMDLEAGDHAAALAAVLNAVADRYPLADIVAVGHRVVHGGLNHAAPILLDDDALADLARLTPFAPLHQPHNLAGVAAARAAFPDAVQIACFDTAFHRRHPFVNDTFALPRRYYEAGVRRYGFHGLSYDFVTAQLAREAPTLHAGRVVIAHLGNGASMCAVRGGQSIASSMGFSALDGLPMGTRSGQVDPGVLLYLMDQEGLSTQAVAELLYKKSGLLGLSGLSHDMRVLLASDTTEAAQAIDYFCFRIRRELGGLAAALEGLDAVVFTGGIGENAAPIRERVCRGMGWLGIELDPRRNAAGARVISTDLSRVHVMVIPTNEEQVIAEAAAAAMRA
ncbi:MAG: acetate/propionate family kinase [Pseudomonadota bacterium]